MYGILIPSLNPNDKLIKLIEELKAYQIEYIFIINDGSSLEYQRYFDQCAQLGCIIFKHDENKGKGRALKTGIFEIKNNFKNIKGIVTADSDGQHSAKDIVKVMKKLEKEDKLILGTRNLKTKIVPLASRIGNTFSSLYFKLTTGIWLKDTQTGLRGIPQKYFDYSLKIPGERFEYEMNYLEQLKEHKIAFETVEIDTIYDDDRTTHFRFVRDSLKIYKALVRNIIVAFSSSLIDILLFYVMTLSGITSFVSAILARIVSGVYNFLLNKVWTFEKKQSQNTTNEAIKYLSLFITQMIISASFLSLFDHIFDLDYGIIFVKLIIDFILFFINFVVMKKWVFHN